MASSTLARRADSSEVLLKLVNSWLESRMVGYVQVNQFAVVHLQEHTGDLTGKLGLHLVDLGVECLSEHLLLLARCGSVEHAHVDARTASAGTTALRKAGHGGLTAASRATAATTLGETGLAATNARNTSHLALGHARHGAHGTATAATSSTHSLLSSLCELHVLLVHVRTSGESTGSHAGGHVHGGHLLGVGAATAALLTRHGTREAGTATALRTAGHTSREGHLATGTGRVHHGLLAGGNEHLGDAAKLLLLLLLHAELVASLDSGLELVLADVLALSEGDVERLALDHLLVHLGDSLGSLIGVAEADESKTLALTEDLLLALDGDLVASFGVLAVLLAALLSLLGVLLLLFLLFLLLLLLSGSGRSGLGAALGRHGVAHNLGRGDGAEGCEHVAELLVVDVVVEVLDVEVDALVLGLLLEAGSLVLLAELLLTLVLLLCATDVELLALEVGVIEGVDGDRGSLVADVVDEAEATALALVVAGDRGRGDVTVLLEEVTELLVGDLEVNVLDVDVGEVGLHLLELAHALLLGDVVADEDLLLVQQHAVDVLDSVVGGLGGLVVDKPVALGVAELVLSDLAAQDVTESSEGVVERLVINGVVEVLDEDVALAGLAQSGVALRPHNAARLALDDGVVQLLKSLLAVLRAVVVNIGVAERATGDGVATDTDRSDLADGREQLEEHGLGDGGVELADVERRRVLVRGGGGGGSGSIAAGGGSNAGVDLGSTGGGSAVLDGRGRGGGFGRHRAYLRRRGQYGRRKFLRRGAGFTCASGLATGKVAHLCASKKLRKTMCGVIQATWKS
jgi:hypothetical protein